MPKRSDRSSAICDDAPMSGARRSELQGCVRCGAPVDLQTALCERCNPLGLAQPSPSQTHGTVFLGIGAAALLLAALAGAASKGVGPFNGSVGDATSVPGGLAVEVTVENTGEGAGSATCQVTTPALGKAGLAEIVTTPRIAGGESITVSTELKAFGAEPLPLRISCGN